MGFFSRNLDDRRRMIIDGSPLRNILLLSVPTLMMAIVQACVPVMDGLFLNRCSSVAVANAVGFSTPIVMLFNALSMGISIAASALLGQINGAGNKEQLSFVASQIMKLAIFASLLVLGLPAVAAQIFKGVVDASFAPVFVRYLSMYSLALPAFFISGVYNAIMNATGKPERSFVMVTLLFLFKLIFNFLFLAVLRLDEFGAVGASFLSGLIVTVFMMRELYFKEGRDLALTFRGLAIDGEILSTLLRLGLPTIISSAMITLGFILINIEVNRFGALVMNAQTIAVSINAICFTLPTAISATVTTMVSIYVGAGRQDKARRVFSLAIIISLLLSVLVFVVFLPFGEFWVRLFRDEDEIVSMAVRALFLYTLSVPFFAVFNNVQAVFIALGRTRQTMVFGVLRIWLFRILFMKLTLDVLGVDAIFMGNVVANALAAILFYILLQLTPWESVIKNRDRLGAKSIADSEQKLATFEH